MKACVEGHRVGKLLSPERRRRAVFHAQHKHGMTERWACRLVNQPRGTQRYRPTQREDEDRLTQAIVELAKQYGRYGYRRITVLLQHAGWQVGKDRVYPRLFDQKRRRSQLSVNVEHAEVMEYLFAIQLPKVTGSGENLLHHFGSPF